MQASTLQRARLFCLFLLVYALFIILWGAFVRISGSGDGCGKHWPLCHGEWIPFGAVLQTWIEFFHRIKSGLFGFLILGFWVYSHKVFPAGHLCRQLALATLIFTIFEALIGAALVIFGWVDQDASSARVIAHSFHFGNTLFLLATMVLYYGATFFKDPKIVFLEAVQLKIYLTITILFLAIGVTGSWAAMSIQLFPVESLAQGFALDFAESSPWFVKLRGLHPFFAVSLMVLLIWGVYRLKHLPPTRWTWLGKSLTLLVLIQVLFGFSTLLFMYPVWMKLTHLLLADLLWINFILFGAFCFFRDEVTEEPLVQAKLTPAYEVPGLGLTRSR